MNEQLHPDSGMHIEPTRATFVESVVALVRRVAATDIAEQLLPEQARSLITMSHDFEAAEQLCRARFIALLRRRAEGHLAHSLARDELLAVAADVANMRDE